MAKPKVNQGIIIAVQSAVIAVLLTAVVAFIGGMHYANHQAAATQAAVKSSTATAVAATVKK